MQCSVHACRRHESQDQPKSGAAPPATAAQWEDMGLTLLAMVLVVLIAAILFRKLLTFSGLDIHALFSQQQ